MSKHPLNLAIRFLLEVIGIITFTVWGYHQSEGGLRILLAVLFPLSFLALWGVFAVRNDPSRSGKTVVPTPGWIRLILELALFATTAWMQINLGYSQIGWIFGGVVLVHYIVSWDRIAWLLKQK